MTSFKLPFFIVSECAALCLVQIQVEAVTVLVFTFCSLFQFSNLLPLSLVPSLYSRIVPRLCTWYIFTMQQHRATISPSSCFVSDYPFTNLILSVAHVTVLLCLVVTPVRIL